LAVALLYFQELDQLQVSVHIHVFNFHHIGKYSHICTDGGSTYSQLGVSEKIVQSHHPPFHHEEDHHELPELEDQPPLEPHQLDQPPPHHEDHHELPDHSVRHVALQPSPLVEFESSHCSP
jgi:hypothetical protein